MQSDRSAVESSSQQQIHKLSRGSENHKIKGVVGKRVCCNASGSAVVSWTPILYTWDPGYYEVAVSQTPGGPYTPCGQTSDKTACSKTLTGLPETNPLYFVVRTVTLANADDQNTVTSLWSSEVTGTQPWKAGSDNSPVTAACAVITAVFDDCFYVESPDRTWGIRVESNGQPVATGVVSITGTLNTLPSGERCIQASSILPAGSGSVAPLGLTNAALRGGDFSYDPAPPAPASGAQRAARG